MKAASAFVLGVLFAVGLVLSGMSSPHNVHAFLDLRGAWDPSLAAVMAGALSVYALFYIYARRSARPVLDDGFHFPKARAIDARLLGGAALFGVGWGLSGYCPGPALMALATGRSSALIFGVSLLAGAWLTRLVLDVPRRAAPMTSTAALTE